jgi:hypothetical protein
MASWFRSGGKIDKIQEDDNDGGRYCVNNAEKGVWVALKVETPKRRPSIPLLRIEIDLPPYVSSSAEATQARVFRIARPVPIDGGNAEHAGTTPSSFSPKHTMRSKFWVAQVN